MQRLLRQGAIALSLALSLLCGTASAKEDVLHVVTALPAQHELSESFLKLFVEPLNAQGKGVLQIDYKGGPEVIPANKAAQAVQRGAIDMLHSPAAYYAGTTAESPALMATNRSVAEIRANGGFDLLSKIWSEKLNAKIVAWGESGAQFHLYTVKEPPKNPDGTITMKGFKMRSTGAYRPLLTALGATPVEMPAGDVYTALQRGLVDGFGWPTVGLKSLGLADAIHYRIDPPFYHLANLVLVNNEKWAALSPQSKALLEKMALEYERTSSKRMQEGAEEDEQAILKAGVKVLKLEGKAADAYLAAAYGAAWERIGDRLPKDEVAALRVKLLK